ncbi:MAG: translesion error-prone DNA polymerase V autoproteolytic subunit [Cyanobium sp.]
MTLSLLPPGLPVPLRVQGPARLCALLGESVAAGFPSPADDYVEARIDLNLELIPSPLSTFFMRVEGDAMRGDGILDGDLLVIDRSLEPRVGLVVVAVHAGGFILRRLGRREGRLWLLASDAVTPALPLASEDDPGGQLWGVAIHAIHHLIGTPSRRHGRDGSA